MKKMAAILLLLLQISCSLLAPQLGYAAEITENAIIYAADHAPENHSLPTEQYPGEDQDAESSLNLEESEEYTDELTATMLLQPLHPRNNASNKVLQETAFLSGYADVIAPPPKA